MSPAGVTAAGAFYADISRLDRYAPAELIGREAELALLSDAWAKARRAESPRAHVITVVALGGEGKTSLVAKWAVGLAAAGWPGCEAAFAWSFYSQGTREQMTASSDLFLKEALTFFGDSAMAESAQTAFDKGRRLAQLIGERRALLILDGLEPLQYPPSSPQPGELKDQGISALLKGLAANSRGLCVVTTRYSVRDLKAYWQTTAPEMKLLRLSRDAGVVLLKSLGVRGSQKELESLVEDVKGHALTVNLLGTYLRDAHGGDIRKRDLVRLDEADAEEQGGHAFRVMDAYVRWMAPSRAGTALSALNKSKREIQKEGQRQLAVLRLLGLFDRPATADCLAALKQRPAIPGLTKVLVDLTEAQWNIACSRLEDARLLTVNRDPAGTLLSLDAHPLLREYFAQKLRTEHPAAWRAAHRRLYEHLRTTTKDKPQPTLEDLQPLYQAVAHGCQAGMQQEACDEVYFVCVLRGLEHYTWHKLGAFGAEVAAQACFFEQPWSRLSPLLEEANQAWLLNEAASCLRALGRLTEALEPMRAGLEMGVKQQNWEAAAVRASNLSELELTLGEVAASVRDAEQSLTYADRSGKEPQQILSRTTLADAQHQAGRRAEAEARFRKAEAMQAEFQPEYVLLYSRRGFQYCDLLLAAAKRAAWSRSAAFTPLRRSSDQTAANDPERGSDMSAELQSCRAVSKRAAQTLKWAQENNAPLLSIALDHLTLGRAALYASILETPSSQLPTAASHITSAVDGLRRAGQQDCLPRGLLTRAWLRFLTGARTGTDSAQTDLDEAWEIAERGPMPLFLADIHLYRARLFHAVPPYPWESPRADLAAAHALIEKHGYWRRKEELEDAEARLLSLEGAIPARSPSASASLQGSAQEPAGVGALPSEAVQPTHSESPKTDDQARSRPTTIVLLTVNAHETDAVLDTFVGEGRVPPQKTIEGVTYNLLGMHGGMSIVHTLGEMGAGGVGASQQRVREAIEHWKPCAVIAVGIAYGLDETKQKMGDVLVATQIQDYELGRVNQNGTVTPRGDKPHTSDLLCNRLRQTDAVRRRAVGDWPTLRFGLVLSGQKLVDNLDYRESLKALYPEAIGGEMEATGLYVSATAAKTDWIVVKAICDWGHNKNQPEKNAWQKLAAANAARVLRSAIDAGAFYTAEYALSKADTSQDELDPTEARSAASVPSGSRAGSSAALGIWLEKLGFLETEEAKTVDPEQKFRLHKLIQEAKAKIREHGGGG